MDRDVGRVPRVVDVAGRAVREGSRQLVVDAFRLAARGCEEQERRGDVRDGLVDMPLPFRAAEKLGLDVDEVVAEALGPVGGRARELLEAYARRPDRADIRCMGWHEDVVDGAFAFVSGDP